MPQVPRVESNAPIANAALVPVVVDVAVTFTEFMDPATLNEATFTVTTGDPAVEVPGSVVRFEDFAAFQPDAPLASLTLHTATITTDVLSVDGLALAEDFVWTFTTGEPFQCPAPVNLRTAGDFVILAKSGIDTVPASDIRGDIGVSPIDVTAITGFDPLPLDPSGEFATASQVTAGISSLGRVFAANLTPPTPNKMTTAVSDMETAFVDAAGRPFDISELGAGDVSGRTLPCGTYKWGTSLLVATGTAVTLTGSATDVWIFEIAGDLILDSAAAVRLEGGALAENVFWQVTGLVDLGTTTQMQGVVLTATSVAMKDSATITGRLLAQTAVTLINNDVIEPN